MVAPGFEPQPTPQPAPSLPCTFATRRPRSAGWGWEGSLRLDTAPTAVAEQQIASLTSPVLCLCRVGY